jgi:CDP-diacylglycerol--serine O-phosphatidyltransferase
MKTNALQTERRSAEPPRLARERLVRRRSRRRRVVTVLPSLLTLANAVCGFAAITYAAKLGPEVASPHDLYYAAILIFIAMVFDAVDGPVARMTKQTSDFGAELDSLADGISFGVAPAFLMLKCAQVFHPRMLWVIAVLYMLCAVMRLARFNVTKDGSDEHSFFRGLPSPAAAGMVASLVLFTPRVVESPELAGSAEGWEVLLGTAAQNSLPIVTLVVACLMVSRIRYPHLVNQLIHNRHGFQHLVKLIFACVVVFAVRELAIPLILFYFVIAPPLRALWSRVVVRRSLWPAGAP